MLCFARFDGNRERVTLPRSEIPKAMTRLEPTLLYRSLETIPMFREPGITQEIKAFQVPNPLWKEAKHLVSII